MNPNVNNPNDILWSSWWEAEKKKYWTELGIFIVENGKKEYSEVVEVEVTDDKSSKSSKSKTVKEHKVLPIVSPAATPAAGATQTEVQAPSQEAINAFDV